MITKSEIKNINMKPTGQFNLNVVMWIKCRDGGERKMLAKR